MIRRLVLHVLVPVVVIAVAMVFVANEFFGGTGVSVAAVLLQIVGILVAFVGIARRLHALEKPRPLSVSSDLLSCWNAAEGRGEATSGDATDPSELGARMSQLELKIDELRQECRRGRKELANLAQRDLDAISRNRADADNAEKEKTRRFALNEGASETAAAALLIVGVIAASCA